MNKIFAPKEICDGETRVAITPSVVKNYLKGGFEVFIEDGAGEKSYFSNDDYIQAGAKILPDAATGFSSCNIIAMFNAPTVEQVKSFKDGTHLICFLFSDLNKEVVEALNRKKICAYAMEKIPRISRAQKLDALSSQANLAGYKAVLVAAEQSPKIFPMLMTAAGTIRPAKVVIMGAGVAGLQAIATAKRLGAIVDVSDIRPASKEQVQSLGANFIEVPTEENMETDNGYAKEASEEFLEKQRLTLEKYLTNADIVVTTAQIPGKPAPKLISKNVVEKMKPGSVIVDLAAESGGNCELTANNETKIFGGIKIIGDSHLARTLPQNASEIYAKNIQNALLDNLKDLKLEEGQDFAWNLQDEIVSKALQIHCGSSKCASGEKIRGESSTVAKVIEIQRESVHKQNEKQSSDSGVTNENTVELVENAACDEMMGA